MVCTEPVSALDNSSKAGEHAARDKRSADGDDGQLESSELGRKDHWDRVYACELANLQEHGDEGELWCAGLHGRHVPGFPRSRTCTSLQRACMHPEGC